MPLALSVLISVNSIITKIAIYLLLYSMSFYVLKPPVCTTWLSCACYKYENTLCLFCAPASSQTSRELGVSGLTVISTAEAVSIYDTTFYLTVSAQSSQTFIEPLSFRVKWPKGLTANKHLAVTCQPSNWITLALFLIGRA